MEFCKEGTCGKGGSVGFDGIGLLSMEKECVGMVRGCSNFQWSWWIVRIWNCLCQMY